MMSNKKLFKKLYASKIARENNYQEILEKIERENMQKKKELWKWGLVPVCLILIIGGVLLFKHKESLTGEEPYVDETRNIILNINVIKDYVEKALDADIKSLDADYERIAQNPDYKFLTTLETPKDLTDSSYQSIYVKENVQSAEYNILNNYVFSYYNKDRSKSVVLAFSNEHEPLRDYFFDIDGKVSSIDGANLVIYRHNDSYMTQFTYNNIIFDLETRGLTQDELIDLLISIIQ